MLFATAVLSQSTLRFVVLGMATGALTALVALSVVIVYRVSGVLNFAAGALGAIGAFVCYWLRDDLGWPTPLAVGAGLLVGTALGLLTYVVLALLRESSLLSRLIATLALLSAAQGVMNVVWDDQTSQPKPFLPARTITLFGDVRIGQDRLILIGLALALALGLGVVYNRTLFGLATSAVSENRRVAAMARWAPARIELVNFLVAGFLAALAAILLAPIVTLNGAILALAVLPALAAALVGRFLSFSITVAAALVIGIFQSELSLFQPDIAGALDVSPASLTGLVQAVPLLVILVVTVLSGRVRPARGEHTARLPLPGSGRVRWPVIAVGVLVGVIAIATAESFADAFITTLGMAVIVASVIVVTGYAGQLSLCQYALAGFGAWVAARMANSFDTPFLLAIVIGVAASVLVGVLVAVPAIRTRGVTLAIVTLALALVGNALIFQNAGMTGGFDGIVVRSPEIGGFDLDPVRHPQRYAGLLLVAFIVVAAMVSNLRRGATGRQMIAVRSNERAAASLGISVVGVKVYAFAVGAGIAALGGILLAFRHSNVQFTTFNVFGSILLVQYAVIGGIGWISGAVLGAAAAPGGVIAQLADTVLPHLDDVESWLVIVSGVLAIQLLRRAPDGMASLWSGIARKRLRLDAPKARVVTGPVRSGHAGGPVRSGHAGGAPGPARTEAHGRELEVRGVTVRFGGVTAVEDVSFRASPGEVVGLIGPNGAGKTTLLDVITGFTRQQAGAVLLDGTDVSGWRPERRARAGIARSWQAVELFDELTVRDNLLVAEERRSRWDYLLDLVRRNRPTLSAFGESIVDDLGLRDVLDQRPMTLPLGLVKLVGIARTIITNPGVILLDEPAAGLDNEESRELAVLIRAIATRHCVAVVVIEHDMALIADTCDRVVVLDFGHKIADGTPGQIQGDTTVIKAYLGEPTTPVPAMAGAAPQTEDS